MPDTPEIPPPPPREKRETIGTTTDRSGRLIASVIGFLGAATLAITSLQQNCETSRRVDNVDVRAQVAAEDADTARAVAGATAEKADQTGKTVEKVAEQYVTRKELEDALDQLGKPGKAVELEPQPIAVPEVVSKDLPAAPAKDQR